MIRTGNLQIIHAIFIDASRTGDYQTTRGILDILDREGNSDDLAAFMNDRNLPIDDIEAMRLAKEPLENPPKLGYLTISNVLQWRLQYKRVMEKAGTVNGIIRVIYRMPVKTKNKMEFGDFQTPDALAERVCKLLHCLGMSPRSILEPTCGKGSFLRASIVAFPKCTRFLGVEVNRNYVKMAKSVEKAEVNCENFFEKNWPETLDMLREPILVIGNPPWVTNSAVATLGGANLPNKTNFHKFNGFDAVTGKSNFDVSEWMLLHLLELLSGRTAALAMLCKTTVARKVLHHVWSRRLQVATSAIYSINSAEHFGVSVAACLLVCILEPGAASKECAIYQELEASKRNSTLAFRDGRLIADLGANNIYGHLHGTSPLKWRSGMKHDCSNVMELRPRGCNDFENGLGKVVKLEPTYLYSMLKSSELMKPCPIPSRYMLVTQRRIGEDTSRIKRKAPLTWRYLKTHAYFLDRRASLIYRNRPRFSIFGVGAYSFAPWKIAISGFYKRFEFRCIGPFDDKPVVLDDTCYFLPFRTECDAKNVLDLLNSEAALVHCRNKKVGMQCHICY